MDGSGPVSWDTVAILTLVLDADVPQGQEPLPLHGGAGGHLPQVLKHQLLLPTAKYNVLMTVKVVVYAGGKVLVSSCYSQGGKIHNHKAYSMIYYKIMVDFEVFLYKLFKMSIK